MENLKELLAVKNQTATSADLYFYGDIVSDWWGAWNEYDQYPEAIKNFLDGQEGKKLNIYINSGGGSVFASLAIYNMLKRHTGKKIVHVDGVAASGAGVIAMAGDEIIIPENAFLMIHRAWVEAVGNAEELRSCAEYLERLDEGILSVYKERLRDGVDEEQIKTMVNAETWLNGAEAAKYFNITTGAAVPAVICASEKIAKYKNTPNLQNNNTAKDNLKRLVIAGLTK